MRLTLVRGSTLAVLAVLISSTLPAKADTKAECAKAYEASQEQRSQDKLRDAHKSMVTCSQAGCPNFIKKDCGKWLAEVEAAMPTVVFIAKAGGQDVIDTKVSLGDETLTQSLDGKAIDMDPGPHTFVFENDKYGKREINFVVKEGQKAQEIQVQFTEEKSGAGGGGEQGGTPGGGDKGGSVSTATGSGRKTIGYVLLGVGAVGLGGFAFFGLSGNSDKNKLACADTKTCTDADLDPIKKKYLYADISLGVGVISAALGTYFLVTAPKKSEAPAEDARRLRFDVRPTRGGGFASVAGAF
jgi:hypothetical protein